MVLRLIEKHGELTIDEIVLLTGIDRSIVEKEVNRLWEENKICIRDGKCYIPNKDGFASFLAVVFLLFVTSCVFIGALKETLGG